MEIASTSGTHLKAVASQSGSSAQKPSCDGKDRCSILSTCESLLQSPTGGNVACLQSPRKGTDEFWMHPAVGDCVIHLAAVPLAGQSLVTR